MRAHLAWSCWPWTPMHGSKLPSSFWREEQVGHLASFLLCSVLLLARGLMCRESIEELRMLSRAVMKGDA